MTRQEEAVAAFYQEENRPYSAITDVRCNYFALSTPRAIEQLFRKEHVLFDSGPNCSVSNDETDFATLHQCEPAPLISLNTVLPIVGHDIVSWTFASDKRTYRTLRLPSCRYVPVAQHHITSPQVILQAYPDNTFTITNSIFLLEATGPLKECPNGPFDIQVPLHGFNLPLARLYSFNENDMHHLVRVSNKPEGQVIPVHINIYSPARWDNGGWDSSDNSVSSNPVVHSYKDGLKNN